MTLPSRLLIRSALIYLVVGSFLGMLLLINKAWNLEADIWMLLPAHIELMLFGWVIQLTLGVAYWILPRYLQGPNRGSEKKAYMMVAFLNIGILLMIGAELGQWPQEIRVFSRTLEMASVILFINLHWNRVVSFKTK